MESEAANVADTVVAMAGDVTAAKAKTEVARSRPETSEGNDGLAEAAVRFQVNCDKQETLISNQSV